MRFSYQNYNSTIFNPLKHLQSKALVAQWVTGVLTPFRCWEFSSAICPKYVMVKGLAILLFVFLLPIKYYPTFRHIGPTLII